MDQDEICLKEVRTIFDCIPPRGGVITAAIIADIIADGLNSTEIAAIGSFITIIGDSLQYISAQMELNEQIVQRNK